MSNHLAKERKETDGLKREALQLGIEIPQNLGWWWEDIEGFGGSPQMWELVRDDFEYLTEVGKAGARKLIREERHKLEEQRRNDIDWQRQGTQWKLTIAGMIIGWILGTLGIMIGLLALFRK